MFVFPPRNGISGEVQPKRFNGGSHSDDSSDIVVGAASIHSGAAFSGAASGLQSPSKVRHNFTYVI